MSQKTKIEAVVLAGGQSRRMGRSKAALRVGGRSMLSHARALAAELGLTARIIRRDLRPGLGPLGGIETALTQTTADRVLFLGCDMPFLQSALVEQILAVSAPAVFASRQGCVGFPFCLSPELLPRVQARLTAGKRSLQTFSRAVRARRVRVAPVDWPQLVNLNTPEDLAEARKFLHSR